MQKRYFKPGIKCMFVGNESLMDSSVQLDQKEASDDWQGAKENTFFVEEEESTSSHSVWDE